jgi:hypothetical protein
MKVFLCITIFAAVSIQAAAQSPVPESDTTQHPIKQTDPELKNIPANTHYVDEMTRITADELPPAVLDSLKASEPSTWEKSVVYKHKSNDLFTVEVRDGGQEKKYRFNKDGTRLKNLDEKK